MKTTEVLEPAVLDAMPDAELLLRMQRLRDNVTSLVEQLAEFDASSINRRPDWALSAKGRLADFEAALQQVRDEGMRRVKAAREKAA